MTKLIRVVVENTLPRAKIISKLIFLLSNYKLIKIMVSKGQIHGEIEKFSICIQNSIKSSNELR